MGMQIAICAGGRRLCARLEGCVYDCGPGLEAAVEIFPSAAGLMRALEREYYDLLLLAADLPDGGCLDVSRFLRETKRGGTTRLVYVGPVPPGMEGALFQFRPFGLLSLPPEPEALRELLLRARRELAAGGVLEFRYARELYRVPLPLVRYAEGRNGRVLISVYGGSRLYTYGCYCTLDRLLAGVPVGYTGLTRISKSCAVNLRFALRIGPREIALYGGEQFAVSSAFRQSLRESYELFRS